MPYVQDIDVSVALGTASVTRSSLRPLIVGSDTVEIATIVASDLTDITGAGYAITDPEYLMAAAMFAQNPRPTEVCVYRKATATAYDAALTALLPALTSANDFRLVTIASRTAADLNLVGTWCNSNTRFFVGCVNDVTAGSGRNIDREAYLISDAPAEYPDAAWVGRCCPVNQGSLTWKWKRLSGISACGYTSTQLATIRTNNTQAVQNQGGLIFVNEGITTSGEYIDVILGMDWVKEELIARLLELYVNSNKVSLDDLGIGRSEAVIRGVMDDAGANGIIAAVVADADKDYSDNNRYQYKVSVPARADISAADLAARKLTGCTFSYRLAGAQHESDVAGTITA